MERYVIIIIVNVVLASYTALTIAFVETPHAIIVILLTTATLATIPLGFIIICCGRRNPKSKGEDLMRFELGMNLKVDNIELPEANKRRNSTKRQIELPLFSFASVSAATNNFSATNKLGEGGFGPVYKGILVKGDEIAVKRLSGRSGQGLEELKNEALVIAKVQHKNLVRLLGCCIDKDEKILIYEYMPNKSLDFFLFGCGYMSPEYALEGMFSVKSDVFSFGVLLLEILSSKKNTGFYQTNSLNLLGYAWDLWTSDRALELIDPTLSEASSKQMMSRYVNIALLCVQEIAEDRPTMSDVVSMLTNEATTLLPPKQPAFSHSRNMVTLTSPPSRPEICSINEVTVSLLQAR